MAKKVMVMVQEGTGELEALLQEKGFEFMSTGVGTFEYIKDGEVNEDELLLELAKSMISIRPIEVDDETGEWL